MGDFKNYEEAFEAMMAFVSSYFLIEHETVTADDEEFARRLTKLMLRIMTQLMELGMRKGGEPVFNLTFYMKDHGGGYGEVRYAMETISGELYERFKLGKLGLDLEEGIKKWYESTFGEELTDGGFDALKAWGGVLKDE